MREARLIEAALTSCSVQHGLYIAKPDAYKIDGPRKAALQADKEAM